ncbi:MAG TPA: GFA family protein [Pseudomonadales bacterium]
MADERTKVTGGCACGQIRFGFYEPLVFRGACHCRACQYTSGGGPAYVVGAVKAQFRVTRGHPAEFSTLSDAGHLVTRAFCANCGTHLYSFSDGSPGVCTVKVGALDEPSRFKPKLHLWTSEAQPWHLTHRFTRRYRKDPPMRRKRVPASEEPVG